MTRSVNFDEPLKPRPRRGTLPRMTPSPPPAAAAAPAALSPADQARGRRLALVSQPLHMTLRRLFTEDLPTLALVSLGAGDAAVGLQRAFEPLSALLQLPSLRALAHAGKRTLLLTGQCLALAGALPLLFFPALAALPPGAGTAVALASLGLTAAGLGVAETPWFPLLHGVLGLANDELGYIIPKSEWDKEAPYLYDSPKAHYGEVNSAGPETAPILHKTLKDMLEKLPK